MKIAAIVAREILDSRGFPTVECELALDSGARVFASTPAGASIGRWEALELRDGDMKRYLGKGVLHAVENVAKKIGPKLVGKEPDISAIDSMLNDLDGTKNKSNLGANATLAVSMAVAKAQALSLGKELYEFIAETYKPEIISLPRIIANMLGGGVHADNEIQFQEFAIMPMKEQPFRQSLEDIFFVYNNLQVILREAGFTTTISDEGAFAPPLKEGKVLLEKKALDLLVLAIARAGFEPGEIMICLDVAASEFYDTAKEIYVLHGKTYSSNDLIDLYCEIVEHYPIYSIEDGLDQGDWLGWHALTKRLGSQVQLIGDDLFVTNRERIKTGIEKEVANAVLIKPNQIGTISETMAAMKLCHDPGYHTIVSHRSGETVDTFIADFVVGTHAGQFKGGACVRGERVAKYNRLLRIAEKLEG